MKTFPTWQATCAGYSPVTGEFPAQRPVMRSFDVFFDLCLNKWLTKQSWGWWFETLSSSLWRHCNVCLQQRSSTKISHIALLCFVSTNFQRIKPLSISCACSKGKDSNYLWELSERQSLTILLVTVVSEAILIFPHAMSPLTPLLNSINRVCCPGGHF